MTAARSGCLFIGITTRVRSVIFPVAVLSEMSCPGLRFTIPGSVKRPPLLTDMFAIRSIPRRYFNKGSSCRKVTVAGIGHQEHRILCKMCHDGINSFTKHPFGDDFDSDYHIRLFTQGEKSSMTRCHIERSEFKPLSFEGP